MLHAFAPCRLAITFKNALTALVLAMVVLANTLALGHAAQASAFKLLGVDGALCLSATSQTLPSSPGLPMPQGVCPLEHVCKAGCAMAFAADVPQNITGAAYAPVECRVVYGATDSLAPIIAPLAFFAARAPPTIT